MVTTFELEHPIHIILPSGNSVYMYINMDAVRNDWHFLQSYGFNQYVLPNAYEHVNYDIHISRQER